MVYSKYICKFKKNSQTHSISHFIIIILQIYQKNSDKKIDNVSKVWNVSFF